MRIERQPALPLAVALIALAALARLVPHPPNLTPVGAMALFAGATLGRRWLALAAPLAAMLLADAVIGGWDLATPFVYGAFAATVGLGLLLRGRVRVLPVVGASLLASTLFFLATNLAVFLFSGMYPPTPAGLLACYAAAIPFFGHQLVGDLGWCAALFGGAALLTMRFPMLRRATA